MLGDACEQLLYSILCTPPSGHTCQHNPQHNSQQYEYALDRIPYTSPHHHTYDVEPATPAAAAVDVEGGALLVDPWVLGAVDRPHGFEIVLGGIQEHLQGGCLELCTLRSWWVWVCANTHALVCTHTHACSPPDQPPPHPTHRCIRQRHCAILSTGLVCGRVELKHNLCTGLIGKDYGFCHRGHEAIGTIDHSNLCECQGASEGCMHWRARCCKPDVYTSAGIVLSRSSVQYTSITSRAPPGTTTSHLKLCIITAIVGDIDIGVKGTRHCLYRLTTGGTLKAANLGKRKWQGMCVCAVVLVGDDLVCRFACVDVKCLVHMRVVTGVEHTLNGKICLLAQFCAPSVMHTVIPHLPLPT